MESSPHKTRNRCPPAAAKKARSLAALQRPQKAPTPARAAGVAETDRKTQLRHWPTAKIAPRYSRCNAFAAPRRSRRSRRPQKRCRTKPRSEAMRNAAKQLRRCQNAFPGRARPRSGRTTYVGEGSVFGAPEGRRLLRTRLPGASAGAFSDRAGLLDVIFQYAQ